MKPLLRIVTTFGVVTAILLIVGSPLAAQSQYQADYDSDDDRLIEISNLEQLDAVRYDLDGNGLPDTSDMRADYRRAFPSPASGMGCSAGGCDGYELTRNLDFNDPGSYASGLVDRGWSKDEDDEGWLPIGTHFERFDSTFKGNGYTISNLFIYRDAEFVGLFGGISSKGSIAGVGLIDVDIDGRLNVGPLAGGNEGVVSDCYATGKVSGISRTGGLVGSNDDTYGTIMDSFSTASVSGDRLLGGLAGGNWYTITGSYATGDVSGKNTVGGVAGHNAGPIGNSYATGNVSGSMSVGGLVGKNNIRGVIVSSFASGNVSGASGESRAGGLVGDNYHLIRGSYATGSVSGGTMVGGLVGSNAVNGTIMSSYAAGEVSGEYGVGGLLGFNHSKGAVIGSYAIGRVSGGDGLGGLLGWDYGSLQASDSYWDIETSGRHRGIGKGPTSKAEGKTTSELQRPTSYTGIYFHWNTDIDDADGDGLETTGTDDPWDFGTNKQYPALKADFDGDGEATWEEFGSQPREGLPPSQTQTPTPPEIEEDPPVSSPGSCANGAAVENPGDNPALVRDCAILLRGRDTLAGSSTLNWSADMPINRWHGITVKGSPPRVVELELIDRPVSGRIPPEFGQLSALTKLDFGINSLTGGIPPELAGLSELRHLGLHGNPLGGKIPPELGGLSKLEYLDINATGLTGEIPTELGNLSSLQILELGQNRLTGSIPVELAALSKLENLGLYQNNLTGEIPPELARLSSLENLSARTNRLTGGIPPELGQLPNLLSLDLSENRLTGEIPQELANLSELYGLILRDNRLTGEIPTWVSDLTRLDRLDLGENQLTGPIPEGLGGLSYLTGLYLHENSLTGPIPSSLGNLPKLIDMKLDHNRLTGPIPRELGSISRLEVMDLSHNYLTGEIPGDFGRLSELVVLMLQNNRLTGSIPPELGNLKKLKYMYLSNNGLSGPIPPGFAALSELVSLRVSGNDLTGCRPWLLANRTQLEIVHDRLPKCAPSVPEGGEFSIKTSRLLEDDSHTVVAVSDAVNGRALLYGTTLTYTHDGSETISGSFTITVADGVSAFTVTLTVPVTPVNDPPIGVPDTLSVDEGGAVTIDASTLLENDSDAENHALAITSVSDAGNGSVFLEETTIIYKHDGSETTSDSFSYDLSDGWITVETTVAVDVNPVNDPPVAVGETAAVDEGGTLTLEESALLDNDTDAENDPLGIAAVGGAVNGSVFLDRTTIIYKHDGSETSEGGFSYTVSDGMDTNDAMVAVAVSPVNDPPVAVGDTAEVHEGAAITLEASDLLDNDSDAEEDALSIVAVGNALNGAVSLDGTKIVYEHDGSETSEGGFSYTASDGMDTNDAMVAVAVSPVNDPPVAVGDTAEVQEGAAITLEASDLLDNDSDAEKDALSIVAVGNALNGAVSLEGTTIVYKHDGSETTEGGFSYTVSDGTDTADAVVAVAVSPVNDPPVAVGDTAEVDEGATITLEASDLLDNDSDAEEDALSIVAVGNPLNGAVSLEGTTIVYEHDGSETTEGGFSYTVSDGTDTSAATVTIDVTPVSALPVALLISLALGGMAVVVVALVAKRIRRSG